MRFWGMLHGDAAGPVRTPPQPDRGMIGGMPMLSVIIVTWNGMAHLPRCLEALVPQLPPDSEIIQVDNGSRDGTVEWVHANYPAVRLIELDRNTGFAGGVAAGLRVARGEFILLLNDDVFVEPNFVSALIAVMNEHAEYAAASAVLLFDHRPELVASAGIRVRRDMLALDLWPGLPVPALPDQPVEIFGPSGGAALYRRAALENVDGMEPHFFAYLEDVDLAFRLRLRGYCTLLVPQARARHVYSATGGQGSPFKQRLLARNRIRVIVRCMPLPLLVRFLPQIIAYDLMAIAFAMFNHQPATLAGRLMALAELPSLLHQRHAIQQRRAAPVESLESWLEPVPSPLQTLCEAQQLNNILEQRK